MYGGVDMLSQNTIEKALASSDGRIQCAAVGNCRCNVNISQEFVDKLRKSYVPHERQAAMLACINRPFVSLDWVMNGVDDTDFLVKEAAIQALACRDDVDMCMIEQLLASDTWYCRYAGISACITKKVSEKYIKEWLVRASLDEENEHYGTAAVAGCLDNYDIPDGIVDTVFWRAKSAYAKELAIELMVGRDVPSGKIIAMLHHTDSYTQRAGLYAYTCNHVVPHAEIADKMVASDQRVRCLAAFVCDKTRIAPLRVVEPPDYVFKKCAGDVIVVARIPEDAQVRGNELYGYRANKAIVEDIYGEFCGVPVGVSMYDHSKTYAIGQEVYVDDFDFGYEPMSTGFHFFADICQAKAF